MRILLKPPWAVGRVVVLELLVAGLVALRSPGNRRWKPRRAFSGLQSGCCSTQRSRAIEEVS